MQIIDPDTGRSLEYIQLVRYDKHKSVYTWSSANKFGRLTQGIRGKAKATNCIYLIHCAQAPKGNKFTYGKFVVSYCTQKQGKEQI